MIAYVAKDSGGANLVLHHALSSPNERSFYLFGIAKRIAFGLNIDYSNEESFSSLVSQVVSGANYPGEIGEMEKLLGKFQTHDIPIDGYLDGWEHLHNRFPEIKIRHYLVVDDYSESIARELYPGKVKRVNNYYLDSTLTKLYSLRDRMTEDPNSVLYLSRPNLVNKKRVTKHGINCICYDLQIIFLRLVPRSILVRDHPLLNSITCINDFSYSAGVKIIRTEGTSPLANDLAPCRVAVGAPTPALGIAKEAGLRVFALKNSASHQASLHFPILN